MNNFGFITPIFVEINNNSQLTITPPWCWFLLGVVVCIAEFLFRHKITKKFRYIILMIGSSLVAMGLILWRIEDIFRINWNYLMGVRGALTLQVLYWLGLAFTCVFWIRPMFYRVQVAPTPVESNEAETITEIEPGKIGRVLYEGCSWQACCQYSQDIILPHQKVYVVDRKENVLYVIPADQI